MKFKVNDVVYWCASPHIIINTSGDSYMIREYNSDSLLSWVVNSTELRLIKYLDNPMWKKLEGLE